MAFKRTPEMTRQVKNIVDALNHKRERMIKEGNFYHVPERIRKKDVWDTILTASDPQEAYDRMIGTPEKPGTLRQALPTFQNPKGGYRPILNKQGQSYAPGSKQIDEAFNIESNIRRQENLDEIIDQKMEDFPQPEWMEDEEYDDLIYDIASQGGALAPEELPDYGTYDSRSYWEFVSNINDADNYVNNYLSAWLQYGTTAELSKLSHMFEKMLKYPRKLVQVFQSGDEEADIDFLYKVYKMLLKAKRNIKTGSKDSTDYIAGIQRIMRYWETKYREICGDEDDE